MQLPHATILLLVFVQKVLSAIEQPVKALQAMHGIS